MSGTTYTYTFNLKDNISGVFNKVSSTINVGTDSIQKKVNGLANSFTKLQACMVGFNQASEMFDKMSLAMDNLVAPAAVFEQNMADLSAITGIAGKELSILEKTARKTGKESGLGASQAAEAYKILASQIDVSKIGLNGLQDLQKKSITLSQASGLEMGEAAQALSGTINQFGLQASEAGRVMNVLAAGSKYGAAEIPELAQSFKVVGAAAASAGLSVEDTAGAIEVLSKNNMKGAEAGTALRNIMLKMQTGLGVDFKNTNISNALKTLQPQLNDVTFLTKTFGMENVVAAQYLIKNADAVQEMTNRVTGTSVATEQAAIRTDTFSHKMQVWAARWDDAKISMFKYTQHLAPTIKGMSEGAKGIASLGAGICTTKTAIDWLRTSEIHKNIATKAGAIWTGISTVATKVYSLTVGKAVKQLRKLSSGMGTHTGAVGIFSIGMGIAAGATRLFSNSLKVLGRAIYSIPIIGWIAGGISLIVAGFTILWNKSEKFRGIVYGIGAVFKTLFGVLKTAVTFMWNGIVKPIFTMYYKFYKAIVTGIWNGLKWIWDKALKPLGSALIKFAGWIYTKVITPIKEGFANMGGFLGKVFEKITGGLGRIFQPFVKLWNKVFKNNKIVLDIKENLSKTKGAIADAGGKIRNDFNEGFAKGVDNFRNSKQKKPGGKIIDIGSEYGSGGINALAGMANAESMDLGNAPVSSGSGSSTPQTGVTKNVTISINKVGVDTVTLHSQTVTEGSGQISDIIMSDLVRVVNSLSA